MFLTNLLTKKRTEIPLFWVNFNYKKYKESGKENSCLAKIHPLLRDDKYIEKTLKELIDYIREEFDLDEL